MIQRDLGDGTYASHDEPVSPPVGRDDAPAEDGQAIDRMLATPRSPCYPDVTVHLSTGCPGNMGSVMDKVRSALRDAGKDTNVMNEIWREVLDAGSFTEALHIVMCWVNVT